MQERLVYPQSMKGVNCIGKQVKMQATPLANGNFAGQDKNVSPDIGRLLDLLARIEIRRQAQQRLTDKTKAS